MVNRLTPLDLLTFCSVLNTVAVMLRMVVIAAASASSACSLITDFSGSTEKPVDAAFTMAECDFKEPNDTRATAAALELTDVGPAAICPTGGGDDRDFYKITLPSSTNATFTISYVFTTTGDLDAQLTDAQGSQVSLSRSVDDNEVIACPGSMPPCIGPLAAGEYYLEVFPSQPGMANRYSIAITLGP